jgi:hypothetical protein
VLRPGIFLQNGQWCLVTGERVPPRRGVTAFDDIGAVCRESGTRIYAVWCPDSANQESGNLGALDRLRWRLRSSSNAADKPPI